MAISTDIEVKGLQQYKSQMKSAQQSVKQLDAELKLAAAEYQNTGDQQKYAQKQTELLTKQIEEQEKVVGAQKNALLAMEKAGKSNTSAYTNLQLQLTNSQTKLATMQSTLNGSNAKFKDGAKQVGEYQGALSSINTKVSFDAVIGGIDSITGAIENGIKKVARFAKELWQFEAGATTWADNIITEAKRSGVSIEDYQRMQYAEQLVDTDFEDIVKGIDKVSKARKDGFVELSETISSWSHVYVGSMDGLESFWAVVEAIQKLPNEQAKADAAMKIFGKSYRELGTLFDEGARQNWEAAMAEAPVLGEDQVKALGEANDALVTMQAEFERLKMELASEMAPVFTDVTKALTEMMKQFNEWLKSDEGQAAIQKLREGLQWIIDNKDGIVTALEVIGGLLAGLHVAEGVLKFLQLINGIKGLTGGGGGAAGGLGNFSISLGSLAMTAAAVTIVATTAKLVDKAIGKTRAERADTEFAAATTVSGWTAEQRQAYEDYYDAVRASHRGDENYLGKSVAEAEAALTAIFAGDKDFEGMAEQLVKMDKVLENLGLWDNYDIEDIPDEVFENMQGVSEAVSQGLTSNLGVFYSAGQAIASAIQAGVSAVTMPQRGLRGVGGVVSNLYINTMNMANNNVQQLVNAIGNNLNRTRYAYGGSGGSF